MASNYPPKNSPVCHNWSVLFAGLGISFIQGGPIVNAKTGSLGQFWWGPNLVWQHMISPRTNSCHLVPYLRVLLPMGTPSYGYPTYGYSYLWVPHLWVPYLRLLLPNICMFTYLWVFLPMGTPTYGYSYLQVPLPKGTPTYGYSYLHESLPTGTPTYRYSYLRILLPTDTPTNGYPTYSLSLVVTSLLLSSRQQDTRIRNMQASPKLVYSL